jgi:hypothetical protein
MKNKHKKKIFSEGTGKTGSDLPRSATVVAIARIVEGHSWN